MPLARESLILDSVELNDLTGSYVLREVDFTPPKKRTEWVTGADADGAELVRDPLFENRTITASLRVAQQATMDAALALVAQIVGKLEEAERQRDGISLTWTPANSTKSITFRVLSGEVTGVPVVREGPDRGWLRNYPILNISLTCKPFGYGSLVSSAATASGSTPLISVDVPSVAGDVPAEGTVVVTDLASKSRRDALWGLEQRYYNPGSPAALLLAAGSLVTTGFAGAAGTLTGAYLSNVISATVTDQATAVCGTGNQPHIGTYRVRARVQATSTLVRLRLAWQDGDGPFGANLWTSPPAASGWCEVDLGEITITEASLGAQRWTGRVEARSKDGSSQTVYVNLLELIPTGEGYGRARAAYTYQPGVVVVRDDFTGLGTSALNGRTAQLGGAWTTAGATTDFAGVAIAQQPDIDKIGSTALYRGTTSEVGGRYGVLGSTMTDTEVGVVTMAGGGAIMANALSGVTARYVDTNNALRVVLNASNGFFGFNAIVGGSQSVLGKTIPLPLGFYRIRAVVYASGVAYATLLDLAGGIITEVAVAPGLGGNFGQLAPGGTLASGKAGLFDQALDAVVAGRYYGKFYGALPPAEPIVINSGQSLEFRHNDVLRRDATGTYGGRPPTYRGARVLIPPAGAAGRTSRIVVAARASDTNAGTDGGVTDNTQVVVQLTPRYVVVPH